MRLILLVAIVAAIVTMIRNWTASRAKTPPKLTSQTPDQPLQVKQAVDAILNRVDLKPRASLAFELEPAKVDDRLASKVGGLPYWPKYEALPEAPDQRLVPLAQINFKQMPKLAGFPDHGLLQFFTAENDLYGADFDQPTMQSGFLVRYWPWPDKTLEQAKWPSLESEYSPHTPSQPLEMRFASASTEPLPVRDVAFESQLGDSIWKIVEQTAKKFDVSEDAIYEALPTSDGHRLGGYPYFTQEDPRPAGSKWRLLLQLDSDEHIMWGDAGVANFFIDPENLARGDFSQIWYNWDCH